MRLFSTLDEDYTYFGEDFEAELLKSKSWSAEKITANSFTIYSIVSVGTLRIGTVPIRIKANVQTFQRDDNSINVSISTKFRPEHYFIFVLFAVFTIVLLTVKKDNAWFFIYPLVLWFPVHAYFQFIIRVQEEMLVNKLVQKLRLKSLPE